MWLIDLERTCGLLIGQCLQNILIGEPPTKEEEQCNNWLQNIIFSAGLQKNEIDSEYVYELSHYMLSNMQNQSLLTLENLPTAYQGYCKLAMNLPHQYDEACSVEGEDCCEPYKEFYDLLLESSGVEAWELAEKDERMFESVVRCFLIMALKHLGVLEKSAKHYVVREVHEATIKLRNKLYSVTYAKCIEDGKEDSAGENDSAAAKESEESTDDIRLNKFCQKVLQRTLFLLLFVKGKLDHVTCSQVQLIKS